MGITKIAGTKAALLLSFTVALRNKLSPLLLLPCLHASMVALIVTVSSHPKLDVPLLFGKASDGSFPYWSMLAFYSYIFPLRLYVLLRRMTTGEPVYNEVCQGLYVGGWPIFAKDVPPTQPAILDCTCELPRSACVTHLPYLCIPTWDSRAPRPQDLELAVRWTMAKRKQNRAVFIHCAFGHGRSVAVMCAVLVSLGVADTWKDAEKMIRDCRPGIRMNSLQQGSLKIWSMNRMRKPQNLQST